MSMKRIVFVLGSLVFLLVSSLGLDLKSANAESISTEDGLKYIESPANYIEYLEKESKIDDYAAEGLEAFKNLSEEEQNTFLLALQPDNYMKLIGTANANPGVSNINIEGNKVPVELQTNTNPSIGVLATGKKTVTATYKLYVLGIKTTTLYSTVVFNYSGSTATKVLDNYGSHSNINPSMIWQKGIGKGYLSGGDAYGRASWTVYSTGSLGFINDSVDFYARGDGKNRYYKVDSTRSDWKTGGWISF